MVKTLKDKIEYEDTEIVAQGCGNDCKEKYYTNTDNATKPVGGSAISVPRCKTTIAYKYTPKTNPFL